VALVATCYAQDLLHYCNKASSMMAHKRPCKPSKRYLCSSLSSATNRPLNQCHWTK